MHLGIEREGDPLCDTPTVIIDPAASTFSVCAESVLDRKTENCVCLSLVVFDQKFQLGIRAIRVGYMRKMALHADKIVHFVQT